MNVNNSSVTGTCLPVSNPVNACVPAPVALYQLEESKWTGVAGEVKNAVADVLHGRAMRARKLILCRLHYLQTRIILVLVVMVSLLAAVINTLKCHMTLACHFPIS